MAEDKLPNKGQCCLCFPSFLPVGEKWFQGYCQLGENNFGIFATGLCFFYLCPFSSNADLSSKIMFFNRGSFHGWMVRCVCHWKMKMWCHLFRWDGHLSIAIEHSNSSLPVRISLKDPDGGFARYDLCLINFKAKREIKFVVETHGGE